MLNPNVGLHWFLFLKEWVIAFDKYCLVWPHRWERKRVEFFWRPWLEWWHVSVPVFTLSTLILSVIMPWHVSFVTILSKVPDSIPDSYLVWMTYSIGKPINTCLSHFYSLEWSFCRLRVAACQVSHHPWIQNGSQPNIREGTTLWLMESLLMRTRVWILLLQHLTPGFVNIKRVRSREHIIHFLQVAVRPNIREV